MRKFSPQLLATMLAVVCFDNTSGVATAQNDSPVSKIIVDQPINRPLTIRPVQKRRVEGVGNMILLNDPNGIKAVKRINLGKYWIGLNCAEVSPALRSQLQLKEGIGLLVVNAFEDSPSQKAGLKEHDLIIKADGKDIGAVGQLIEAVQKAGNAELKLEVIREGQPKTITVKSAERPTAQQGDAIYLPGVGTEQRLLFTTPGGTFTFIEPGVIVAPDKNWVQARTIDRRLPPGVSITVKRKSGEAAAIHVEQGDKTWDITPDGIDQLPGELRPHVLAMLSPVNGAFYSPQNAQTWATWLRNKVNGPATLREERLIPLPKFEPRHNASPESNRKSKSTSTESEIEKLKRELSDEMKQLRKSIEELKNSRKEN
jgi:hypothetical protein